MKKLYVLTVCLALLSACKPEKPDSIKFTAGNSEFLISGKYIKKHYSLEEQKAGSIAAIIIMEMPDLKPLADELNDSDVGNLTIAIYRDALSETVKDITYWSQLDGDQQVEVKTKTDSDFGRYKDLKNIAYHSSKNDQDYFISDKNDLFVRCPKPPNALAEPLCSATYRMTDFDMKLRMSFSAKFLAEFSNSYEGLIPFFNQRTISGRF